MSSMNNRIVEKNAAPSRWRNALADRLHRHCYVDRQAWRRGDEKDTHPAHIKLALNAYSFNDMLTGNRQKDNKPTLTLPELLDWCATQNIDAVDLTGYYFPRLSGGAH